MIERRTMGGTADPESLAAAYPWPGGRPWLRAMMLVSLDGASTGPDHLSGSISSPADQRVFAEARRLSDAVMVGARTLVAEDYQPITSSPEDLEERSRAGLAAAPRLVVVSGSLDLPWGKPVFTESTLKPIVVTTSSAASGVREVDTSVVDLIELPGAQVDPSDLCSVLRSRGLSRLVCEGGPHLLASLAGADEVDEADISIAPIIVGGGQIVTGSAEAMRRFDLVNVLVDDGYLFNRYVHPRHRLIAV